MMKQFIAASLIGIHVVTAGVAFADPVTPPAPAVTSVPNSDGKPSRSKDAVISPLSQGQVAPFAGVLLSPQALATIVTDLDSIDEQVEIETTRVREEEEAKKRFAVSEVTIKLETDKRVLQAQVDSRMKTITALEQQLKKEEANRPNRTLWAGLGFGAGVLVTVATVFAVSQVSK